MPDALNLFNKRAAAVLAFFILLHVAIAPGTIGNVDTYIRQQTTRALWRRGTLESYC